MLPYAETQGAPRISCTYKPSNIFISHSRLITIKWNVLIVWKWVIKISNLIIFKVWYWIFPLRNKKYLFLIILPAIVFLEIFWSQNKQTILVYYQVRFRNSKKPIIWLKIHLQVIFQSRSEDLHSKLYAIFI